MQEQYITLMENRARIELEKARIAQEKEKTELVFRSVIIGEFMITLVAVIYIISKL